MIDGGTSNLAVKVEGIDAGDLNNRAESAWNKIGAAAQATYGGNVTVGDVNLTVYIKVDVLLTSKWVAYNFPAIPFTGGSSIHHQLAQIGRPPGAETRPDPAPCDPELNACCEDCGAAQWAFLTPFDFLTKAFVSHDEQVRIKVAGRKTWATRRRFMA